MPLPATTNEAPAGQGESFRTTSTNQEEVATAMFAQTVDISTPLSVGRHLALGGRMPNDAVRFVCPDPIAEPEFGFYVLEPLAVELPTLTGCVEVIRDAGSATWEVEVVNLNTRSRGMTPAEARHLAKLIYAAGRQAQLLNEGISPQLAVLVGRSILNHPAGTR